MCIIRRHSGVIHWAGGFLLASYKYYGNSKYHKMYGLFELQRRLALLIFPHRGSSMQDRARSGVFLRLVTSIRIL